MKRQGGFTLLEVLVALVVFGLLLTGLSQGLRFGLDAWRTQAAMIARGSDLDAVDRLLRNLIAEMAPGDPSDPASTLTGTPHSLAFRSRLPQGLAMLGVEADMALGVDAQHALVLRSWPHYASLNGAPPISQTPILQGVRQIDIDYWNPQAARWGSRWDGQGLPGLVRIRLLFDDRDPRRWPDIVAAPRRQRLQA